MIKKSTLAIAILIFLNACGDNSESIRPEKRILEERLNAECRLVPYQSKVLRSQVSGKVSKINYEVGEEVSFGQVIFTIENTNDSKALSIAKRQLLIANKKLMPNSPLLGNLYDRLAVVKKKYELDSLNYIRYKREYDDSSTSKEKLKEYRKQALRTSSDVESTKQLLLQTKSSLNIDRDNAMAFFNAVTKKEEVFDIRSTENGELLELFVEEGDEINAGTELAYIGNTDSLFLKCKLKANSRNNLEVGQQITAKSDFFGDSTINLKIGKIYLDTNGRGNSIFIDCYFESTPKSFDLNSTIDTQLFVNSNVPVLCVPKEYIFSRDSIYVLKNGKKEARKIEVGIENDKYVEVISGIGAKDRITK